VINAYGIKNNNCTFCENLFCSSDRQEFIDTTKCAILAMWRTMRVEVEEKGLEQKISEAFDIQLIQFKNGASCVSFYEMAKYTNPQLSIPKNIKDIHDCESNLEKYLFRPSASVMFGNFVVNTLLLSLFENKFDLLSFGWHSFNYFLINAIINRASLIYNFHSTDLDEYIPNKLFANIEFSMNEFAKIIIFWSNIFIGYFIFGETVVGEADRLGFITAISFTIVIWTLSKVIRKLHFYIKEEQKYQFL